MRLHSACIALDHYLGVTRVYNSTRTSPSTSTSNDMSWNICELARGPGVELSTSVVKGRNNWDVAATLWLPPHVKAISLTALAGCSDICVCDSSGKATMQISSRRLYNAPVDLSADWISDLGVIYKLE